MSHSFLNSGTLIVIIYSMVGLLETFCKDFKLETHLLDDLVELSLRLSNGVLLHLSVLQ
jgi:hypothetical protein